MDTTSVPTAPRPDTREIRALVLYRTRGAEIVRTGPHTYEVPSQDGTRVYEVVYGGEVETCTCPDFVYRNVSCVHLLAVGACRAKRRASSPRRLAALSERHDHELMDEAERCELLDEIRGLRRRLGL